MAGTFFQTPKDPMLDLLAATIRKIINEQYRNTQKDS
jgi:hypothetical protein